MEAQSQFKHIDRKALKKEGGDPVQPAPKKQPVPAAKKEEVQKPPSKEFKMNTHFLDYYGKEVLKFSGDDVQFNYGFVLSKCKDT